MWENKFFTHVLHDTKTKIFRFLKFGAKCYGVALYVDGTKGELWWEVSFRDPVLFLFSNEPFGKSGSISNVLRKVNELETSSHDNFAL